MTVASFVATALHAGPDKRDKRDCMLATHATIVRSAW